MSFGANLQYLRKMMNRMTQEELAEKLSVSRQTVSKWELDLALPEVDKIIEICSLFSCSMDELVRGNMKINDKAYSPVREETVKAFDYIKYEVISCDPETDAIEHVRRWARDAGITEPVIYGWDFPQLSQEQINVLSMHGYCAALVTGAACVADKVGSALMHQNEQKYMVITVRDYPSAPFVLIPNAYKALMQHMEVNGIAHKQDKSIIDCFEHEYEKDGVWYMDIYIAAV